MATQHHTDLETLRARVEQLGHKLVTCPWLRDRNEREYTGLYILNPDDEIEIVSAGSPDEDVNEIAGWCHRREQGDATADDFNGPGAASEYDRFLELIAVARSRDRFQALRIWREKGVGAAIEFLDDCEVTREGEMEERLAAQPPTDAKYRLIRDPRTDGEDYDLLDLAIALPALGTVLVHNENEADLIQGVASAMRIVGSRLNFALNEVDYHEANKVQRALAAPDTRAEQLVKQLRGTGYNLLCDVASNSYALGDSHGNLHMSIVSLDEIEDYLREKGVELSDR